MKSALLSIAGLGLLVYGLALIWLPLAWIGGGALLVYTAHHLDDADDRNTKTPRG